MNAIHAHLILNHIPVLGSIFGLILLSYGLISKNITLQKTGLITLIVVTLFTIPVFLTGDEAEHAIEHLEGTSEHFLEEHEELGELSLWLMVGTGILSLLTYLSMNFFSLKWIKTLKIITLVIGIITFAFMANTAWHGGQIRHFEINTTSSDLSAKEHFSSEIFSNQRI